MQIYVYEITASVYTTTDISNNESTSVNPVMCFLLTDLTRPRHHNNG